MKTRLVVIAILFFALYSNDAHSQYYGNNRNRMMNNRSIADEARMNSKKKEKKQDYAENASQYMKQQLKLDGLQEAAVKTIINDNKGSIEEVMKMDISNEEKRDKMLAINDKIDKEIMKLLSPEQIEKYNKMKEEREKKALTN